MIFEFLQAVLLLGIVSAGFLAVKSEDLLKSVIFLAAMSLLLTAQFYLLQAPDVAIAEAAIGAGLSTAIFVMAIKKTKRREDEKGN